VPSTPHLSVDIRAHRAVLRLQSADDLAVTPADIGLVQTISAALAAGGTLLSDSAAPAFWVLADPEGNEACVCTWQGRD
jgi:hypothetical protein